MAASSQGDAGGTPAAGAEKAQQAEEALLWAAAREEQDRLARTKLILEYLPLARGAAKAMLYSIGGNYLEYADLVQFATIGLIEAIDRFDPRVGVPFRAFAEKRVKGAVLDGVAGNSEMHAQMTYRHRHRRERVEALRPERPARGEGEIFAEMVDMALGLAVGLMLEGTGLFNQAPNAVDLGYGESGELAAQSDLFRRLLEHLPETERAVLDLHYGHGLQFGDVAKILDLSKGRISQLHKTALAKLRQMARTHSGLDLRM